MEKHSTVSRLVGASRIRRLFDADALSSRVAEDGSHLTSPTLPVLVTTNFVRQPYLVLFSLVLPDSGGVHLPLEENGLAAAGNWGFCSSRSEDLIVSSTGSGFLLFDDNFLFVFTHHVEVVSTLVKVSGTYGGVGIAGSS